MLTKVKKLTKDKDKITDKLNSMLVQYNFFIHLIFIIMKLFVKILRVLEIAIPFLKMIADQFRKDKEKKQEAPAKEV